MSIPETLDGLPLTEAQRARLARLVAVTRMCDRRLSGMAVVEYACDCLRQTVVREGDGFRDRGRIFSGGRSFAVT